MPRVKSAQAKAAKRPSVPVRRAPGLRRLVANARPVLLVVGVTACVGVGLTAWTSGWIADRLDRAEAAMLALTVELGFGVEEVRVAGRSRTDRDTLLSAVGVERGTPILSFRPEMARAAILEIPWVKSVRVERRLPDTILVRVEERRPMAIWQHQQRLRVIAADGMVLTGDDLDHWSHLPLVVGADAPAHAAGLIEELRRVPDVAGRVVAAVRIGGRRWELRLDNGVSVSLPERGLGRALARLAAAETTQRLIDRDIVAIDLRLADRMVIQATPMATERRRLPEEDT